MKAKTRAADRKRITMAGVALAAALLAAGSSHSATRPARAEAVGTTAEACAPGVPAEVYAAYVRGAQVELNAHGYDAGRPTGNVTAQTEAAVRQYQKDAGLPVDGCVTKRLLDHLYFVLPKVERARGPRAKPLVVEAQAMLTRRGYYLGAADGLEGARTRAAVRQFQRDAGKSATGVIDQSLIEDLKSADPTIRGDRGSATAQ